MASVENLLGSNRQAAAPDKWVDNHGDFLFRFAWQRLQDRDVAEDMVQETFAEGLRGLDTFQGRASERTWLVGILRHKIVDHIRKTTRETLVPKEESFDDFTEEFFDKNGKWAIRPTNWETNPKNLFEKKEFWQVLARCLKQLPQRMAHAFALRELEETAFAEISQIMKISQNNLNVILYRARTKLRRCLEVDWFGQKTG